MVMLSFIRCLLINSVCLLAMLFSLSLPVQAGGIALGGTRVIYPADAKQVSLSITNTDKKSRFLIQSWIEGSNGKKTTDFILTPPLFVSKPSSENTLRIMYVGPPLPNDRETLFWLNSKAIPAVDRQSLKDKNVLQIAILSRIKLFVRPTGLPIGPSEAITQLKFSKQGKSLTIDNPSPYFITLTNFYIGNQQLANTMINPKSDSKLTLPSNATGEVTYQTINDYGGVTTKVTANLQ